MSNWQDWRDASATLPTPGEVAKSVAEVMARDARTDSSRTYLFPPGVAAKVEAFYKAEWALMADGVKKTPRLSLPTGRRSDVPRASPGDPTQPLRPGERAWECMVDAARGLGVSVATLYRSLGTGLPIGCGIGGTLREDWRPGLRRIVWTPPPEKLRPE